MAIRQENIIRRQANKQTQVKHSGIEHWHHYHRRSQLCCPSPVETPDNRWTRRRNSDHLRVAETGKEIVF